MKYVLKTRVKENGSIVFVSKFKHEVYPESKSKDKVYFAIDELGNELQVDRKWLDKNRDYISNLRYSKYNKIFAIAGERIVAVTPIEDIIIRYSRKLGFNKRMSGIKILQKCCDDFTNEINQQGYDKDISKKIFLAIIENFVNITQTTRIIEKEQEYKVRKFYNRDIVKMGNSILSILRTVRTKENTGLQEWILYHLKKQNSYRQRTNIRLVTHQLYPLVNYFISPTEPPLSSLCVGLPLVRDIMNGYKDLDCRCFMIVDKLLQDKDIKPDLILENIKTELL